MFRFQDNVLLFFSYTVQLFSILSGSVTIDYKTFFSYNAISVTVLLIERVLLDCKSVMVLWSTEWQTMNAQLPISRSTYPGSSRYGQTCISFHQRGTTGLCHFLVLYRRWMVSTQFDPETLNMILSVNSFEWGTVDWALVVCTSPPLSILLVFLCIVYFTDSKFLMTFNIISVIVENPI